MTTTEAPAMTAPAPTELLKLADEIEQSSGLLCMVERGTRSLGIKRTAQVIAALRHAASVERADDDTKSQVFEDICEELGCAYANEAVLEAICNMKKAAVERAGVFEATTAQHVGLKQGDPAQFVRDGKLEICRCAYCRTLEAPGEGRRKVERAEVAGEAVTERELAKVIWGMDCAPSPAAAAILLRYDVRPLASPAPRSAVQSEDTLTRQAMAETIHKARWPVDRQMEITPFEGQDHFGKEYCLRIADAVLATLPVAQASGMQQCPNCHDANSCGDYEGPVCEVCMGVGRIAIAPAVPAPWNVAVEECAKLLDEAAQDWNRIRDPGMANNARSYAKKIRALAHPSAHHSPPPEATPQNIAERMPSSDAASGGGETCAGCANTGWCHANNKCYLRGITLPSTQSSASPQPPSCSRQGGNCQCQQAAECVHSDLEPRADRGAGNYQTDGGQ